MFKTIVITLAALFLTTSIATAAPVVIDTPSAYIIVIRALDTWSGDRDASEDSLAEVSKHRGGFVLASEKGPRYDTLGYPMMFGFNGDSEGNPVVHGVIEALKPLNFKLHQDATNFKVENAGTVEPKKFAAFANYQRELYRNFVTTEGNPATLHNSVFAKKILSGALAIGTVAVAGDKYGFLGKEAALNSNIPSDLYQFGASGNAAITPLDLPDFDATGYKAIDVRRVIQGNNDRAGQIIIAYKNDKTEEASNAALIAAIVSLTGADTTVEEIEKSRAADLAKRQAIWDACVSEGKCKN